jgi:O-antigen/teichoic acid export membrane protein
MAGLLISLSSSSAIQVANVVTGVILARSLGPDGRGNLAAVILWPSILAAVGGLGINEAATFYTAREEVPPGRIVGTCLALCGLQSVLLMGLGAAIFPAVFADYPAGTLESAYIFLAFIPLSLTTIALMGVLNGLHRYSWFHFLRLAVTAATAIPVISLAVVHAVTVENAVLAYAGGYLVTTLAACYLIWRARPGRLEVDRFVGRRLMNFGVRSQASNVSLLVNERLDQLVISLFLAPRQLGLYVTAVTFTQATMLIGNSVAMVALPTVSRRQPDGERAVRARALIHLTVVLSAIVSVPIILLAEPLLDFLFGHAFTPAASVMRVLLVAAVVLSTNRALQAALKGFGRPLDAGVAEALALAATCLAIAVLMPLIGLMGAAVASLIAYSVSMCWMLLRLRRLAGTTARGLLIPRRDEFRWVRTHARARLANVRAGN